MYTLDELTKYVRGSTLLDITDGIEEVYFFVKNGTIMLVIIKNSTFKESDLEAVELIKTTLYANSSEYEVDSMIVEINEITSIDGAINVYRRSG